MKRDYSINIIIEKGLKGLNKDRLRKTASQTLRLEGIQKEAALNILLTGDEAIQILNKRFLGRDRPTDVIAFGSKKREGFIGEIAISTETAECNAKRFSTSPEKEIYLYIIHGILHLLGYGDKTKKEKRIIGQRQGVILRAARR